MKTSRSVELRRQGIVEWVGTHGLTQVDELAERFNTSQVTVRKDLTALASAGKLIRQFGGAAPLPTHNLPTHCESETSAALAAIGKAAAQRIVDGCRVVLDCGSTTAALLPYLQDKQHLVVMTNSLQASNFLTKAPNNPNVLMTGGTWDPNSQSFQGLMAEKMVAEYSFDIAIVGAAGIDVGRGTTTFNELTGLTNVMADSASDVVVVAASNKLKHKMPNLELGWKKISTLVTDSGISHQDKIQIEQQGVSVVVAALGGE